jgi:hypothetical protein
MNKTIYIKNELGKKISEKAEAEGISFGKALMEYFGSGDQKIHSRVETILEFNEKLDRIESKLDKLVGDIDLEPPIRGEKFSEYAERAFKERWGAK